MPVRQRKKPSSVESKTDESSSSSAFTKHAAKDAALQEPQEQVPKEKQKGLTFLGNIAVFLGFPTVVGLASLYLSFARNKYRKINKELDLDTDFVFPFLLALCVVIVIGFQTKNFTRLESKPLVQWPKVRRKKTIVHKRVIVNEDGTKEEEEVIVEPPTKADAPKKTTKKQKSRKEE